MKVADEISNRREFGRRCANWTVGHLYVPVLTFDAFSSASTSTLCLSRYVLIDCGTRCSEVAVAEVTAVDRRTGS